MFIKSLRKKNITNKLKAFGETSDAELKSDDKSIYYENIAQSISLIELEKEMQSGLDRLI